MQVRSLLAVLMLSYVARCNGPSTRAKKRQVWGAQASRVLLAHAGLNPFTGKPMAVNQAPTDVSRMRGRYSIMVA